MATSLFTFIEKVRTYEKGLSKNTKDISDACKNLEKAFADNDIEKNSLVVIRDLHRPEIMKTKYILLGLAKKEGKIFRSIHDRFVKVIGIDSVHVSGVTLMFEKLVRGVTYFINETDPDSGYPVYHRFASCGKIGTQDTLSCVKGMPRMSRNITRSRVEKCYIERLIYDKLYTHESLLFPERGNVDEDTSLQDEGHLHYLGLIEKEYAQCFKDYSIEVDLLWNKDIIPSIPDGVVIVRKKRGEVVSKEVYNKTIQVNAYGEKGYEEMVFCTRETKGKHLEKYQSYLGGERAWKTSAKAVLLA